ncbi:hypothetical protein HK102_007854 [Quaeritorhiza haematococci]|nr:hypothetical protein HK102_007854 [Quaeritorhiza haematococci]
MPGKSKYLPPIILIGCGYLLLHVYTSPVQVPLLRSPFPRLRTAKQVAWDHTPKTGAVAAPDPLCQAMGNDILQEGGSAVDAAITTSLCSGVINSYASGIGGGAFMMIRPIDGEPIMIDCRETAPEGSTPDMFTKEGTDPLLGGLSVGVPGELKCFEIAHKRFGRLPWARLFEGPSNIARYGFKLPEGMAGRIKSHENDVLSNPSFKEIYAPTGKLAVAGDIIYRQNLADTFDTIAKFGVDYFYTGPMAKQHVDFVQKHGGILTLKDMQQYEPVLRKPITATYRDRLKLFVPTAESGGPAWLSMLNIVEKFDVSEGPTTATVHAIIEAIKFGMAERTLLGDPDFSQEAHELIELFTNKTYATQQAQRVTFQTHEPDFYGENLHKPVDDRGTCHISVLVTPKQQNGASLPSSTYEAVSITTSNNYPFGSWLMHPETGVILNDQMGDFSIPGTADALGHPSHPNNFPEPGKRPLSSMTPLIIETLHNTEKVPAGSPVLVIGASGGPRITTSVLQSTIAILDWGYSSSQAVSMPRFHHALIPNELEIERDFNREVVVDGLEKQRGHVIDWLPQGRPIAALVQAVRVGCNLKSAMEEEDAEGCEEGLDAAADPRLSKIGIGQ